VLSIGAGQGAADGRGAGAFLHPVLRQLAPDPLIDAMRGMTLLAWRGAVGF
jgi:hypothetical protein